MSVTEKTAGCGVSNEQYVLLAKSAKGCGLAEMIKQLLEAPSIYVFGEILDMPNVQQANLRKMSILYPLLTGGPYAEYFELLKLFAYGTYADYKENKATLPALSPLQLKKLKHLTIVSLATKNKCLSYQLLLRELDISNLRELEDLIIEVIYADVIRGKMDQTNQQLEVDYTIGRDIQPVAVREMITVLQQWCTSCESVLSGIETQVARANEYKERDERIQQQVDEEVINIRKTLKTTQQNHEMDEQMVTDEVTTQTDKPNKKASKSKGLRGSSKLWGKLS